MAALHGHEELIELLVQSYNANVNIRDYSGKKPKHYLKISAQAHTQHVRGNSRYLLQPAKKPEMLDDVDTNANVKSNSGKPQGISSLLIPLNNNIRASFRRSKTAVARAKSPPRSPNLFRRASALPATYLHMSTRELPMNIKMRINNMQPPSMRASMRQEKSLNSNKQSKKKLEKQRPVSEQPAIAKVNSDPDLKKSFFI
ncbi:uncharacterized protein LOC135495367 isoform X2 [Lineus longissimus]|uniref:uncharacterized protein LOC135495367 isoform X2 n=1 Tax=Lineus longissimus TaxID=88925 RepID=UPI00315CE271